MIEYRKGNLLDVTEGIIVHGCNAQGVMGSGVALAVKKKYPEAYDNLKWHHKYGPTKVGDVQLLRVDAKLFVVNAITQQFYGKDGKRYVNYASIVKTFLHVLEVAKSYGLDLHFPKIGAGLGGGDWNIIEQLINDCDPDDEVKKICWEL